VHLLLDFPARFEDSSYTHVYRHGKEVGEIKGTGATRSGIRHTAQNRVGIGGGGMLGLRSLVGKWVQGHLQ